MLCSGAVASLVVDAASPPVFARRHTLPAVIGKTSQSASSPDVLAKNDGAVSPEQSRKGQSKTCVPLGHGRPC